MQLRFLIKHMMSFFGILFCALGSLAAPSHAAHRAHDQKSQERISVRADLKSDLKAGEIKFFFKLYDSKAKKNLNNKELVETHTKLLHFIAYDAAKNEFNHVHPIFKDQSWLAELKLPVNGDYSFWVQGSLKDGTEFSSSWKTKVVGGQPENTIKDLGEKLTAIDGATKIEFAPVSLKAGEMSMIDFKISRTDTKKILLTDYLGAFAHVIAVSPKSNQLIHVHPMKNGQDGGMIHATFPEPGDYRIWVQMNDQNELKTWPLSVRVSSK